MRRIGGQLVCTLVLGGVAPFGGSAFGAIIGEYARLDIGASGQRVEGSQTPETTDDWTGIGTVGVGAAGVIATTPLTSLTGDSFSIAVDNGSGGNIDFRDRGDSTSAQALARLGEDFIKNNSGIIRVTLGGLEAGEYSITSYHRDSDNGQSDQIQVFVTDSAGTNVLQSDTGNAGPANGSGIGVNNLTTANMESTAAIFNVVSNGTDNVVITFNGSISADDETPLNGLHIQAVPEPATLGALGLVSVGLLARRRRNA